jgi:MFS family permease
VTFAAVDNVALVFLIKRALHGSGVTYGLVFASFGVGMVAASLALSARAGTRPAAFWLIGGIVAGAAGTVATGLAPTAALACAGQAVAGAGNTADLVGTDTLVQQRVPADLLGRAFGTVYAGAQLASILSSIIAGPLVALAGARTAFVIAGAGALLGLSVLIPALSPRGAPPPFDPPTHAPSPAVPPGCAGRDPSVPPGPLRDSPDPRLGARPLALAAPRGRHPPQRAASRHPPHPTGQ